MRSRNFSRHKIMTQLARKIAWCDDKGNIQVQNLWKKYARYVHHKTSQSSLPAVEMLSYILP